MMAIGGAGGRSGVVPAQGDPAAPQGCRAERGALADVTLPAGCPPFPAEHPSSTGEMFPPSPCPSLCDTQGANSITWKEPQPRHPLVQHPPAPWAPQKVTSARPSSSQPPSSHGELPPCPVSPASSQFFFLFCFVLFGSN